MAAFMALALEGGVVAAVPLEASWGLASGILGPEPEPVVAAFLDALRAEAGVERPRVVAFSGTDPDSRAAEVLGRAGARPAGLATDRIVASLDGGLDGLL